MTTAFIISLVLFLCAFIAFAVKKGELNASEANYHELKRLADQKIATIQEQKETIDRKSNLLKEQNAAIIKLNEKVQMLITEGNETVEQFRSKVDELLVTNEGLKNETAGLNRKISDYQTKLKHAEELSSEKDKEIARFSAETKDLRQEYDILKDASENLSSRIITVYRDMPSTLTNSRKAERLSVNLRKYITETPTGVSLQIVVPFPSNERTDANV